MLTVFSRAIVGKKFGLKASVTCPSVKSTITFLRRDVDLV